MGFMKFMKKDKNMDDSLDIPPPPPMDSAGMGMPSLSEDNNAGNLFPSMDSSNNGASAMSKENNMNNLPPMPEMKMPDNNSKAFSDLPSRDLQPLDSTSFEIPPISMPKNDIGRAPVKKGGQAAPTDIFPKRPGPKSFDQLFKPIKQTGPEKSAPKMMPTKNIDLGETQKSVFIEVTKYRQILKDLNNLKKSLKQSDDNVSEIIGDINDEEKAFSGLYANLSDVEHKLVQLENSLSNN